MNQIKHIVIVGLGTVGAALCALLARIPSVGRITLVDPDTYECKNVAGQAVDVRHAGRGKCAVQAAILKRIRPDLEVRLFTAYVEQVPAGNLACDLLVSCLDSGVSRQYCNTLAFILGGVPFVDAGVLANQMLARVSVYLPSAGTPCLECSWSERDYQNRGVRNPCQADRPQSSSTNAPAYLGALAASLQAAECAKLLGGLSQDTLAGKELVMGVGQHTHCVSRLNRNPACRFDHDVWSVEPGDEPLLHKQLGHVLAHTGAKVSVPWARFALQSTCTVCRHSEPALHLYRFGQDSSATCPKCGGVCETMAFDWTDRLSLAHLNADMLGRTLSDIGIMQHDVLTRSTPQGEHHILVSN